MSDEAIRCHGEAELRRASSGEISADSSQGPDIHLPPWPGIDTRFDDYNAPVHGAVCWRPPVVSLFVETLRRDYNKYIRAHTYAGGVLLEQANKHGSEVRTRGAAEANRLLRV
eukprot:scaffold46254_cov24-Prasinocladus_malaysianus.AAC.1